LARDIRGIGFLTADQIAAKLGVEKTALIRVLDGCRCIFLAALYWAEREIAEKLKALASGKPPRPAIDGDKAIPSVETRTKLALADSQRRALRTALVSKVLVITGDPGVGKTTLVNSLLKILIVKRPRGFWIRGLAPRRFGCAARRSRSNAVAAQHDKTEHRVR
jgi:exodeoxyribonuclease V alpha subunit